MKRILAISLGLFLTSTLQAMEQKNPVNNKRPAPAIAQPAPKRQYTAAEQLLADGIEQANVEKVRQAIAARADVNMRDKNGLSPLTLTIFKKNSLKKSNLPFSLDANYDEIAELLLINKADPNLIVPVASEFRVDEPDSLLSVAAREYDNARLVRLLLNHDARPILPPHLQHCPILYMVIETDTKEKPCTQNLKALLEYGTDPNIYPNNTRSPLYCAVTKGNADAVELLLDYGADVNKGLELIKNAQGIPTTALTIPNTPIGAAIANGRHDILKLLLDYGADTEQKASLRQEQLIFERTPLVIAGHNHDKTATGRLLDSGAQPSTYQLKYAMTEFGKETGKTDKKSDYRLIVELLLLYGAPISDDIKIWIEKLSSQIPYAAAFVTCPTLQSYLEEYKKKHENQKNMLKGCLAWAASKNNLENIEYLLAQEVDPRKALYIVRSNIIRTKASNESLHLFEILASKLPENEETSAFIGQLLADTLKLNNIESCKTFLKYNPDIMPSLHYLDNVLMRPLQPAQRDALTKIRDLLTSRAPLHEQIIRKQGPLSEILMTNIRKIHAPELRERIIAQLRRETLIERRIEKEKNSKQ